METGFDYKIRTTVSTDKFSNERNSNYLIYFCAQKSYFLNIFIMVIVFIQYLTKYSNSWQWKVTKTSFKSQKSTKTKRPNDNAKMWSLEIA